MKKILNQLFDQHPLSRQQAAEALDSISNGNENDAHIAAFLTAFRMRPIKAEELLGFRDVMLEKAKPISWNGESTIDIVGTGGDGKNTFNISTLTCFVVAGAGYKVTKHGNYASSSHCGSSNVLESLGYQFTNDEAVLKRQIDEAGICFLHAPLFHPSMKYVAGVRKQLGFRTFFNLLGPIVNPIQPSHSLLGVSTIDQGDLYQQVLSDDKERNFKIVHAIDGYDEISLTGDSVIWDSKAKQHLSPNDFGLKKVQASDIFGGERVEDAKNIFLDIISGNGTSAQNSVVIANAAMAIQCMDNTKDVSTCIEEAKQSLLSKRAFEVLKSVTSN